jgi:hypothetical protein
MDRSLSTPSLDLIVIELKVLQTNGPHFIPICEKILLHLHTFCKEYVVPNPDLETETPLPGSHCEHLQGAWQFHCKRRDCFGSLAMTIPKSGFGLLLQLSPEGSAYMDMKLALSKNLPECRKGKSLTQALGSKH